MPREKREKPLYQRGDYRLYERPGRNHEIIWYDSTIGRERSTSARSRDVGEARQELDRKYLAANGSGVCSNCGRAWDGEDAPPAAKAITDYLVMNQGKAGEKSARNRLSLVISYIAQTSPDATVPQIDERWIDGFRKWMKKSRYSAGHTEGCILQFRAAINAVRGHEAQFKVRSLRDVAQSPRYRASVETIASMFRFCIDPPPPASGRQWSAKEREVVIGSRVNLLRYLRAAVATWARPDAIYDIKAKRQWHKDAAVLELNPIGRDQTKKHRPIIPVASQFAPWLDEAMTRDNYLPVSTVRHGWDAMRNHLGLPGGREAGEKLIRRSIATIARRKIGEANWVQGEMMLGHSRKSISDIYAIPNPANLGLALAATEEIIEEIENFCPGAYRTFTADETALRLVEVGKNG